MAVSQWAGGLQKGAAGSASGSHLGSTYGAGEECRVLAARVEHLQATLNTLCEQVKSVESRQVTLDRRLSEMCGEFQDLREEQHTQSATFEQHQRAIAAGTQRALANARAVQERVEQAEAEDEFQTCLGRWGGGGQPGTAPRSELEARFQDFGQQLMDLSADVAALCVSPHLAADVARRASVQRWVQQCADQAIEHHLAARGQLRQPAQASSGGALVDHAAGALSGRIEALESGQRKIALSAYRALHTAITVQDQQQQLQVQQGQKSQEEQLALDQHQRQQLLQQQHEMQALEEQCMASVKTQEARLDKMVELVDVLTDKVLVFSALQEGGAPSSGTPAGAGLKDSVASLTTSLREQASKVQGLEGTVYSLATQLQGQQRHSLVEASVSPALLGGLDVRVERGLQELGQRLDLLQASRDEHRLSLRQLSQQMPELAQQVDKVGAQYHDLCSRVREHDVHIGFFRASFESHKQQMLDLADTVVAQRQDFVEENPLQQRALERPLREPPCAAFGGDFGRDYSSAAAAATALGQGMQDILPPRPAPLVDPGARGLSGLQADSAAAAAAAAQPPGGPPSRSSAAPDSGLGEPVSHELGSTAAGMEERPGSASCSGLDQAGAPLAGGCNASPPPRASMRQKVMARLYRDGQDGRPALALGDASPPRPPLSGELPQASPGTRAA